MTSGLSGAGALWAVAMILLCTVPAAASTVDPVDPPDTVAITGGECRLEYPVLPTVPIKRPPPITPPDRYEPVLCGPSPGGPHLREDDGMGTRTGTASWVIQSNDGASMATPIWDQGIHGEGVIVGVADTGLDYDHIAFRNNTTAAGEPGPFHRKVVKYTAYVDDTDDSSSHGTHICGIIAGDSIDSEGAFENGDGMAYMARIAFYDLTNSAGSFNPLPNDIYDILNDSYSAGARSMSLSWGDDYTSYTTRAQRIDQFCWDHPDMLVFVAPGNTGGQTLEPATSKSCVGVGNSNNGAAYSMSSSNCFGPTEEGMTSPTIVAPGSTVYGPYSDGIKDSLNSEYRYKGGTSMAAPIAAGSTALVQQYFQDGFYPSGEKNLGDGFVPSGPLRKAVLALGAADMAGGSSSKGTIPPVVNSIQGWGRINLNDSLYFKGEDQKLWVDDLYQSADSNTGLLTGQRYVQVLEVGADQPLRVSLSWFDHAGKGLMNDLDLSVSCPGGEVFAGNRYLNGSSVEGGLHDRLNTLETINIPDPEPGLYWVMVNGFNVPFGPQRFAISATGNITFPGKTVINLDRNVYGGDSMLVVSLADPNNPSDSVDVQITSTTEPGGETLSLAMESGTGLYQGELAIRKGTPQSDGFLQVSDGDDIQVIYSDTDPPADYSDVARVDASPPQLLSVDIDSVFNTSAGLSIDMDEPGRIMLELDTQTDFSNADEITIDSLTGQEEVALNDLEEGTTYHFRMILEDMLGNRLLHQWKSDWSFTTPLHSIAPGPMDVGWVEELSHTNHMGHDEMLSGMIAGREAQVAMLFGISEVGPDSALKSAELLLHVRRWDNIDDSDSWLVEILDESVHNRFNGTVTAPLYSDINGTQVISSVGVPISGKTIKEGGWICISFQPAELGVMQSRLAYGAVAMRIVPTFSQSRFVSFDTGLSDSGLRPRLNLVAHPPPRISPDAPTEITLTEDVADPNAMDLHSVFTDPGNLEFSTGSMANNSHLNLSIRGSGYLSVKPDTDWFGYERIFVRATNINGVSATHIFIVTVTAVNDPPRIDSIGAYSAFDGMVIEAYEGDNVAMAVEVTDPDQDDADAIILGVTNPFFNLTTEGKTLSFYFDDEFVGTYHIQLWASDGKDTSYLNVTVIIHGVNEKPTAMISVPQVYSIPGRELLVMGNYSSDPDTVNGDSLTFSWSSPQLGDLGNSTVARVNADSPGIVMVNLTVTDSGGLSDTRSVVVQFLADTDGDGMPDDAPPDSALVSDNDDDNDGMPDSWEEKWGFDPLDDSDGSADEDGDNLTNIREYDWYTNPINNDSDGDGFPDGWEVENGFDPINASSPGEGYSKNEGTGEIDNGEDQGLGTGFLVVLVLVFVGIVAMLVLSQFNFFRGLPGEEDDDLEERRPARERTDGPRKARKDKSDPDKEEKKPRSRRKVVAKRKTN